MEKKEVLENRQVVDMGDLCTVKRKYYRLGGGVENAEIFFNIVFRVPTTFTAFTHTGRRLGEGLNTVSTGEKNNKKPE
jgi:hypothetical protein